MRGKGTYLRNPALRCDIEPGSSGARSSGSNTCQAIRCHKLSTLCFIDRDPSFRTILVTLKRWLLLRWSLVHSAPPSLARLWLRAPSAHWEPLAGLPVKASLLFLGSSSHWPLLRCETCSVGRAQYLAHMLQPAFVRVGVKTWLP